MPKPSATETRPLTAPSFYLTGRQTLRPGAILPATTAAVALLSLVCYSLGRSGHAHASPDNSGASRSPIKLSGDAASSDKDDPSQIDTVFLGDPADVPAAASPEGHASPVHPTITVRLPRFGDEAGLIPDTPAGHLFYGWLAAFNQTNYSALRGALPDVAIAAQVELRQRTGGLTVLSAREVKPGILVFRLRDQIIPATEYLGTLEMRTNRGLSAIAKFSLHAVSFDQQKTDVRDALIRADLPQ